MRLLVWLLLATSSFCTPPAEADECVAWGGETPLQVAVDSNSCLTITPGSYTITSKVVVNVPITIHGNGATITADWEVVRSKANDAIFRITDTGFLTLDHITLDGANEASYLVTPHRYTVTDVTAKNAACSAFGVGGPSVTIRNSVLSHNGHNCLPYSGLDIGAGIYGQHSDKMGIHLNPVISGNVITDSLGPALDMNGVWGGTFSNNTVWGNTGWAAVSLFGSSYWTVSGNAISQPSTTEIQDYHPACVPNPARSAAIFLCQDSQVGPWLTNFNAITNNRASGFYGILLIGDDETTAWVTPRLNTISGNDVRGSSIGCLDDLRPGQWHDGNLWSRNNCAGTPNTKPRYV